MTKERPVKKGRTGLLGIIVTGFLIGIVLLAAAYVIFSWTVVNNYADDPYTVDIGIDRVNDSCIYVETHAGGLASKLLDSSAPGWGCFNVTTEGREASNYVDAGGMICSSKAMSRQNFTVPLNTNVTVVANFKDNTSMAIWTGVI